MIIEVTNYVAGQPEAGLSPEGRGMERDHLAGRWHDATCAQLDDASEDCHCWGSVQAGA